MFNSQQAAGGRLVILERKERLKRSAGDSPDTLDKVVDITETMPTPDTSGKYGTWKTPASDRFLLGSQNANPSVDYTQHHQR